MTGANRQRGFTLIELLLVVALIAIAASVATLALRDPSSTQLEHEGARLVALLESARAESRASGVAVRWEPNRLDPSRRASEGVPPGDFRFIGMTGLTEMPTRWLQDGVSAEIVGARAIALGPEPIIGPQAIVLRLDDQRLTLATDGLGPFAVSVTDAGTTP